MPERKQYRLLGKILVDSGLISEVQLSEALERQKRQGDLLGRILVELGYVKEQDVLRAIGTQTGMEFIDLTAQEIPEGVVKMISPTLAKAYKVIPVKYERDTLTVALSDPLNVSALDDFRFMLNCNIVGMIAKQADIEQAIQKYYGSSGETIEELLEEIEDKIPLGKIEEEEEITDALVLHELASQAPVVRLLNLILVQAVRQRASDIHFEPFEDIFKVRYRVDGVLYDVTAPPKNLSLALASRIKVISNLDIAERRLPQDGRITISVDNKDIDLRVSTLPTIFGESVVMRVLDKSVVSLSLDQLGFSEKDLSVIKKLVKKPNGIVLATGPTGSGKTTTLYSGLKEINKIDYKIITTEDPVEYDLGGIIQVSVRPKINLNFATCLRHILRQDPDIIMVGEIRDLETAQIAVQASLTGHLVFSTLHTNDAPGAVTRLINIGIEPYLITSTLEAVLAQRLVRMICEDCKEPYTPNPDMLAELEILPNDAKDRIFYRGKGCRKCNNTGFKGRTAIFELLQITDELRPLILEKRPAMVLREKARQAGMRTLREDGVEKIFEGITTVEEVLRETQQYK